MANKISYKLKYSGEEINKLLDSAQEISGLIDKTNEIDKLAETVKNLKKSFDEIPITQGGCLSVTSGSAGSSKIETIEFATKFNNTPSIILVPIAEDNKIVEVRAQIITTSNFKISVKAKEANVGIDIYWIAMEQ